MTRQDLRDLLRDRVADESMPDFSARAWQAGRRVRRRHGVAVVGGAIAVTVAVSIGVMVLDSTAPDYTGEVPQPLGSQSPAPDDPDASYEGVPVWWSPDQFEERELPSVATQLPSEMGPAVVRSMNAITAGPAIAAFGLGDEVYLHGRNGGALILDVSSLDDVATETGYRISPLTASMLSPDGRHLVFPQNGSLALYSIETGEWSGFSTGDDLTTYVTWMHDGSLMLPSGPAESSGTQPRYDIDGRRSLVGPAENPAGSAGASLEMGITSPYGPWRTDSNGDLAQSWGMGLDLPVREPEAHLSQPEFMAVRTSAGGALLAFMDKIGDGQDTRWKQCCPVAGWLNQQTVVYESRQTAPRLVAWTVGTNQFRVVSIIKGKYDVASFARLSS